MRSRWFVSGLGLVAFVAVVLALGGCTELLGTSPLVLALLVAIGVASTGCLPTYTPCCVEADAQTGVGRLISCECPAGAICNYLRHYDCTDVEGACVPEGGSVRAIGANLECAGDEGPTSELPCCMDDDGDGVGVTSTCRCPVFAECAWGLIDRAAQDCGGGVCATVDARGYSTSCPSPERSDAGASDGGAP